MTQCTSAPLNCQQTASYAGPLRDAVRRGIPIPKSFNFTREKRAMIVMSDRLGDHVTEKDEDITFKR